MKKDIHPTYYPKAKVTCACGNTFTMGATREHLEVEVCSNCHPFYTGQDKIMDKVGRVQKFKERLSQKQALQQAQEKKPKKQVTTSKQAETKQKGAARVTTKKPAPSVSKTKTKQPKEKKAPVRPIDKTRGKQAQGKKA